MATANTTLKLDVELKARIAPLAEAAGMSMHAWMVDVLEPQAALAEMREALISDAQASAAESGERPARSGRDPRH